MPALPQAARLRLSFVALTLAAGACAGLDDRLPAGRDELRAHIELLASDRLEGRLPGTPGYDAAAAYVARTLARACVRPGARDARGAATWYQPLAMVRQRVGPGTVVELRTDGKLARLPHGQRTFLLLAAGRAAPAAALRPPVFVGNAVHAPAYGLDDFAGLDLSGRPVLVTAFPPRAAELARAPAPVRAAYADPKAAQMRRLRDIGAARASTILLLPDRWLADEWDELSAERRRLDYEPVERPPSADSLPPIPVAMLHADLVDRLFVGRGYHPISHAGRYHTFELSDVALRLLVDIRREPFATANVVGLVPGRDRVLRREYVVVSARLDGQGREGERILRDAGDAAACAALLRVARGVAAHPPRRSVLIVLFTAEQPGRWGSRHFLAHLPPPISRRDIVAAIDVGALAGAGPKTPGIQVLAAPALLDVARAARADRVTPRRSGMGPDSFQGTTAAAFDEAGVPALRLADGPPGPTLGDDDASGIDLRRLDAAARVLARLIERTANARTLQGGR